MKNDYQFLVRNGQLSDEEAAYRQKVASERGIDFYYVNLPDGWRSWFAAPNEGEPYNQIVRDGVLNALERAAYDK